MNKELFKLLIEWFFDENKNLPPEIEADKKFIKYINIFIYNLFIKIPKFCYLFDKYDNTVDYWTVDPIERIKMCKDIIKEFKISYNDLHTWKERPSLRTEMKNKISNFNDDEINFIFEAFRNGLIEKDTIDSLMSKTEKNKISKIELESIKNENLTVDKQVTLNDLVNENPFIDELIFNQQMVDAEGLQLFDINILNKSNKILYIFIDKNGNKKTLIVPYIYRFYISKKDGIINNDYFEKYDPEIFEEYILTEAKSTKIIQNELTKSFEKFVNFL